MVVPSGDWHAQGGGRLDDLHRDILVAKAAIGAKSSAIRSSLTQHAQSILRLVNALDDGLGIEFLGLRDIAAPARDSHVDSIAGS